MNLKGWVVKWLRGPPIHEDRMLRGFWSSLEFASGALLIWGMLGEFAWPEWWIIPFAGRTWNLYVGWMDTVFWVLSFRFLYKSWRGIQVFGKSADWLDTQDMMACAWPWIEAHQPEEQPL